MKIIKNGRSWWKIFWCIAGFLFFLGLCNFISFSSKNGNRFSKTNYVKIRRLLHEKKLTDGPRCVNLHHINSSRRCDFVRTADDCKSEGGLIEYIQFPYCTLSSYQALAYVLMVFWLIFLFILVGTTADDYFCPTLTVISDTLNLSPNVAGVTFLAYGNGAPDIFTAVAGFAKNKSTEGLALSALLGGGMFVTTVVVGMVSLSRPCDLNQRPYLRDVVFYLGALAWTAILVYKKKMNLLQAIGFVILYIFYVLVVIIGRIVYQRYKRLHHRNDVQEDFESSYTSLSAVRQFSRGRRCENLESSIPELTSEHFGADETTPLLTNFAVPKSNSGNQNFVQELFAVSRSDFVDSGLLEKVYTIIKIPINLCLNLTIPVVAVDEANHNWNKRLQILQCVFSPLFCVFASKAEAIMIGGKVPLAALVAVVGVLFAVVVAITSAPDRPPRYHKLFLFMAFIASVLWIYSTANEIVNLLKMFGVVFDLSNEILGVTLLAWGNSIGDFVTNPAIAKRGYPQMAIAACFGGPLLNLLLGVGLSCTIATSRNEGTLALNTSNQDYISTSFLAMSLISSAIVVPLTGFRISKIYGAYLILLYAAFLIVSILNESGVLFK